MSETKYIDLIAKVVDCTRRAENASPYYREKAEEDLTLAIVTLDLSIKCLVERVNEKEERIGSNMPVLIWDEAKNAYYIKFVSVSK